jgi:hypothetical protein
MAEKPEEAVVTAECLPDAAIARVLSFLTQVSDLRSAELVSKHWLRVALESRAWLALAAAQVEGLGAYVTDGACARACKREALSLVRFTDVHVPVPALASSPGEALDGISAAGRPSGRALCKRILALACAEPTRASIIAEALAASSTVRSRPLLCRRAVTR